MSKDWLDQLVGEWTFVSHDIPDEPAKRREGTETVRRRGAWVVIEANDESNFQLAINPETGKATGDFVHWRHPQLWTYEGAVTDGRLHLASRGPSLDGEGEVTDYEDVFEITSPDSRRLTGRLLGQDGQWRDFMVTTYHRKQDGRRG